MDRAGVSPIVAVIIVLMMSVSLAVGAFTWMDQLRQGVQDQVEGGADLQLAGVSCDETTITASVRNGGDQEPTSSTADLYLYTVEEDLMQAYTGIDITGSDVREPGGRDTFGAITPTALSVQDSYVIEVDFADDNRELQGLCLTESGAINRLPNPTFEDDETGHFGGDASRTPSEAYEGSYAIIGGGAGFGQWDAVWWVRERTTGAFVGGETYTLSTYVKNAHGNAVTYGFAGCGGFGTFQVDGNTDWHRETVTFTVPSSCGTPDANGETKFQVRSTESWGGQVYFDNTVLLRGGDWQLPS